MKIYLPDNIKGMTEKEVRSAYGSMRKALNKRLSNMEKRGLGTSGSSRFKSMRGMTEAEVRHALAEASRWARDPRHTVRGEERFRSDMIDQLHEKGYDWIDESNFYDFTEFMEEMRERYGAKAFDSGDAADVFNNAQRIGIKTEALKKNFDYFAEHLDDLERLKPVRSEKGATLPAIKRKIRKLI